MALSYNNLWKILIDRGINKSLIVKLLILWKSLAKIVRALSDGK